MRRKLVGLLVKNLGAGTGPRALPPYTGRKVRSLPGPENQISWPSEGPELGQDADLLSSRLAQNSGFLPSLPATRGAGSGVPAFPHARPRVTLPPTPAPPRLCHRSTHQLPPPGFRSATSAARASRFSRPPASLSSTRSLLSPRAAPRPGAGSEAKLGHGPKRPGCRAQEEGAPSPLGAVSMLCTWGRRAAGGPSSGR